MKYLITVKSPIYNGVTEGVLFSNGKALVEDEKLKDILVINYGYKCEEIKEEQADTKEPEKDITQKTKKKA